MEKAEIFQIISFVFFGLCILFLIITVILYFRLDIRGVIGDITGSTARKQIASYREQRQGVKRMSGKSNSNKKENTRKEKVQPVETKKSPPITAVEQATEFYEEEEAPTDFFTEPECREEQGIRNDAEDNVTELFEEQAEEGTDIFIEVEDSESSAISDKKGEIIFEIIDEETQLSSEEDIL